MVGVPYNLESTLFYTSVLALTTSLLVGAYLPIRRRQLRDRQEDARLVRYLKETLPPRDYAQFWAKWKAAQDDAERRRVVADWMPDRPVPTTAGEESQPASDNAKSSTSIDDVVIRLAQIETRLPATTTIAQVSSANEARLGVLIEHLERDLDRLTARTLGRGDVVAVVLAVLGSFGGLLALIPWLVERFQG